MYIIYKTLIKMFIIMIIIIIMMRIIVIIIPIPNRVNLHVERISWSDPFPVLQVEIGHSRGIDGYSRLVVYLKCSDNNRAETVGNSFLAATEEYCWPSRVRTDKGGENAVVARLMIERRGEGRGSILQGSSVHNQRIERLWRDMRKMVSEYYRRLFYFLESHLLLDPIGEVDLFSLHFVFIPRINNSLSQFRASWNNHKLSTKGQKTPNQLYILGMLRLCGLNYTAVKDFFEENRVPENYGILSQKR